MNHVSFINTFVKESIMNNAWPLWALPFWTMGIPLIWAFVEKWRTPKSDHEVRYDSSPLPRERLPLGA